jgi:hypothetical protein
MPDVPRMPHIGIARLFRGIDKKAANSAPGWARAGAQRAVARGLGSGEKPMRRSSMRSLVATIVIVALGSPAYAQLSPGGAPGSSSEGGARPSLTLGGGIKSKTEDELKEEKERDSAYKAGAAKIPDQKAKSDPWGNLRTAAPKPTAQKPTPK